MPNNMIKNRIRGAGSETRRVPSGDRTRQFTRSRIGVALALAFFGNAVLAFEIDTGDEDLKIRWDNTIKYSAAARLHNPSATLTSAAANSNNPNLDDGDRNFNRGLISNRLDIFSEFDASYRDFGFRMSGAGWYDSVYNKDNDNPGFGGGAYPNQASVPANHFVRDTRKIEGRDAEVLDAFVFGHFTLGNDSRASFRFGQHAIQWGETLFFGSNGIAGGMMPVDAVKLLSVPNTLFKEAILPVPMLSGELQITPKLSVGAYYQLRWKKSRIPTVGSYFDVADSLPDGAERLLLAGPGSPYLANAPRLSDQEPKNSGQGGIELRMQALDTDFGVYLIRYHDKTPQQVVNIGIAPVVYDPEAGCTVPNSFSTGPSSCGVAGPVSYRLAYPQAITSLGVSASKTFGDVNLASELSFRRGQPLSSGLTSDPSALTGGPSANNAANPAYPVGRTAHFNTSALWSIPANPLFREGSLAAELGWNRVLAVTRNPARFDPDASRGAVALRGVLQATYRQVATGLDLSPLLGLGWAPKGSRSSITTTGLPQNGNGDLTLGVDGVYQDAWRTSLSFTHYLGTAGSFLTPSGQIAFKQYYADRDFVALSVRRSF